MELTRVYFEALEKGENLFMHLNIQKSSVRRCSNETKTFIGH